VKGKGTGAERPKMNKKRKKKRNNPFPVSGSLTEKEVRG